MVQVGNWKKPILIIICSSFFLLILSACNIITEKDILHIRTNLDDYQWETIPYEEELELTINTNDVINEFDEPIKLTSIYDSEVYLMDVLEDEVESTGRKEILVAFGFDGHVKEDKGTLLSTFKLNAEEMHSNDDVEINLFNDDGKFNEYSRGSGDNAGSEYEQVVFYRLGKDDFMASEKWTVKISGLHLLTYDRK